MEEQPKPRDGGSKLTYIPSAKSLRRLDPWWILVVLVVVLLVVLVTVRADPFWNILIFVRDGYHCNRSYYGDIHLY